MTCQYSIIPASQNVVKISLSSNSAVTFDRPIFSAVCEAVQKNFPRVRYAVLPYGVGLLFTICACLCGVDHCEFEDIALVVYTRQVRVQQISISEAREHCIQEQSWCASVLDPVMLCSHWKWLVELGKTRFYNDGVLVFRVLSGSNVVDN